MALFLFAHFLDLLLMISTLEKKASKLVVPLILIISFYILVNMYWIYPYAAASQIRVPNPPYELTKESLELLSGESNFINSFRIMAYWLNSGVDISNNQFYSSLWTITTFVVPVTAFSALIIRRSIKFTIIFATDCFDCYFPFNGNQISYQLL